LIRITIILAFAAAVIAPAAEDPGATALNFLTRVKGGSLQLERDTALFQGTTEEKKQAITQQLGQLEDNLQDSQLEVTARSEKGELAAVIVRQRSELDPLAAQVHAVGLIRRDGTWRPAPVPGSFENIGIDYLPQLAAVATSLEEWMLQQRTRQLNRLLGETRRNFLDQVEKSMSRKALESAPAEDLTRQFLDACRALDLPKLAAMTGGLESPRPPNWETQITLMARELERLRRTRESCLFQPQALQTIRIREPVDDLLPVDVVFFDPTVFHRRLRDLEFRGLEFRRSSSSRHLILPYWLGGEERRSRAAVDDAELEEWLPLGLAASIPARPAGRPEVLMTRFLDAMQGSDFREVLACLRTENLEQASAALLDFTRLWRQQLRNPELLTLLQVEAGEDLAWGLYHPLSRLDQAADRANCAWMVKSNEGWLIDPLGAKADLDIPPSLSRSLEHTRTRNRTEWLKHLGWTTLPDPLLLDPDPEETPVDDFVTGWLQSLDSSQLTETLPYLAVSRQSEAEHRALQFLKQELVAEGRREKVKILRNGNWAAASIRHITPIADASTTSAMLHPILLTAKGPRVLPEAVLYKPDTRAQTFLNRQTWNHLGEALPADLVDALRPLLEQHLEIHGNPTDP
jgi:hypothetical protein